MGASTARQTTVQYTSDHYERSAVENPRIVPNRALCGSWSESEMAEISSTVVSL